jgi:hypothetical protein
MTDTIHTERPAPPHQISTQLHSDNKHWAHCTCGWYSVPCANRDSAGMLGAEHVNPVLAQVAASKSGNGWKIAFIVWNLLAVAFVVLSMYAGGSAANDCITDTTVTYVDACQAGAGLGGAMMLGVVLFVILVGNGTLGVAYAIFRKQR